MRPEPLPPSSNGTKSYGVDSVGYAGFLDLFLLLFYVVFLPLGLWKAVELMLLLSEHLRWQQ